MVFLYFVLFFKQKTAYEMRISDWSSDVCSSDLRFDRLAEVLGLGAVHYKDESARFGRGSFKPLGGAYAALHLLAQRLEAALGHPVSLDEIRDGRQDRKRVVTGQRRSVRVETGGARIIHNK